MSSPLPIGKLRQNPTEYLRAVSEGASFTITNHLRPVADLVPHRTPQGVSGAELMRRVRKVHQENGWLDELREDREAENEQDPWA